MNEIRDTKTLDTDIVIVGSGAAGLTLALRTADFARVTVLSKGDLQEGATYYAQGGIAAVLDDSDSIDSHVTDTLHAGVGLCHRDVVEHVVERSASAVSWLVAQGVPFTTKSTAEATGDDAAPSSQAELSSLHLTQEGGHSHRRIIHATDATGKAVFQTLQQRAREHANITLLEGCTAVDLVTKPSPGGTGRTCVGVYVLVQESGRVEAIRSRFVALA
ncbi:MAG: FAD-binding protein, partial [Pseudohongiellaceae bacterium]